jgi:glycosyltransferase involved in cell wall biosynthesis
VGSGPDEEQLKQQADRLGIGCEVRFQGAISNAEMPALYRRATVFVAPSIVTAQGDQEGLGLVLVEALACECPVLASDLPAIRDVVIDGVSGLIFRQKDVVDLAAKVCYLLDHPDMRETLGKAGRQHVQEHFDWAMVVHRYAELIDELAQEKP